MPKNGVFNSQSSAERGRGSVRAMFMSVFILGMAGVMSPAGMASVLMLPELPAGCHYTSKTLTPLSGEVEIPAGLPAGGVTGSRSDVARVAVQCDAATAGVPQEVTLAFQSGTGQWREGLVGGDVALTSVRDMGVRWFFDMQTSGSQIDCTPSGTLGRQKDTASCRFMADGSAKSLSMVLSAQWVKLGNNLPLRHSGLAQVAGGDMQVVVNGISTPLSGVLGTTLSTQISCTLETPVNQVVDFGQVVRPGKVTGEMSLGMPGRTPVAVRCLPVRSAEDRDYKVTVRFTPGGNGMFKGDDSALSTSMDDMIIRFSTGPEAGARNDWAHFNTPLSLEQDVSRSSNETGSVFMKTYYWFLRVVPVSSGTRETGKLSAMATYTITVE